LQLARGVKLRPTEADFGVTFYESTNYSSIAEDSERSGAGVLRSFAITSEVKKRPTGAFFQRRNPMIIATITEIPGREHKVLGLVKGSIVQSKHIGRDIMAGFKTIVGGEIKGYTEMLSEARQTATDRMIEEARKLGADAILGVRFESASIMQNAAELLAYGTAVKF
jgi:uncharacterized protein YbjQ (UPF0145 family)